MSKVGIMVPCYNQAEFLSETLESVIAQSHQNWECIVVNDGSTDNTEETAQEWCNKDHRIKYIPQQNSGVSAARNVAIKMTDSEFILPLDADDKIHPDYLKDAIAVFKKNKNVNLVYAEAEYFGSRTGRLDLPEYDYKSLLTRNLIYSSAFFRRTDWENAGGYDEDARELEDWEFWIRLLYGEKIVYRIPDVRFYYRMHANSRNLALVYNDEKRKETECYIFSKHQKIYEDYLGSVISNLRSILKLNTELSRIKTGMAYKLSTKIITLAAPLKKVIKRKTM